MEGNAKSLVTQDLENVSLGTVLEDTDNPVFWVCATSSALAHVPWLGRKRARVPR